MIYLDSIERVKETIEETVQHNGSGQRVDVYFVQEGEGYSTLVDVCLVENSGETFTFAKDVDDTTAFKKAKEVYEILKEQCEGIDIKLYEKEGYPPAERD